MHSINTNINTDDVVVLSPSGTLCFSLLKQTFETFGIEAAGRSKADKKHDKHGNVDGIKQPENPTNWRELQSLW